ncbi:MAG: HNH endonuclease signature motif containing protein [Rhodospirillaceae bacterium]|nr:HNH endonuclease signature motif containing protein [Rhodospirillaceae bacterium]
MPGSEAPYRKDFSPSTSLRAGYSAPDRVRGSGRNDRQLCRKYAAIADRSAADALAGLIVANEVQDQREARLNEKPDSAPAKDGLRKIDRQKKKSGSSEMPGGSKRKNDGEEKNTNGLSFDFSDIPPVLEKFDDNHNELLQHKDYWENRATLVEIFAELDGKTDVAGFVRKTIAAERQEVAAHLGKAPDTGTGRPGIVLAGGRGGGRSRPQRPRSIGREITQRGIDLRAEKLLKQIRKYDPGFWQYQLRAPGQSSRYTRKDIRLFEETLRRHQARETAEIRKRPGTAWSSRKLPTLKPGQEWLRGSHGNGGFIPEHIAAQLRGKQYRSFDHFRSEFWKAIAADPITSRRFPAKDIQKMRRGNAPEAHKTQWIIGRKSYEIHHANPIKDGGRVYDMRNMMILTPRMHDYILPWKAHYGSSRTR